MRFQKLFLIILAVLIAGCASQESMFNKAKKDNSVEAYENFLQKYPDGEFSVQAKSQLAKLEYQQTKKINSIEAYEKYLEKYPDSEFSVQAKSQLAKLEYQQAKKINSIEAYEKYLEKYPDNEFSNEVKTQLSKLHFEKAKITNTIEGYESYLQKYPEGEYTAEVKSKIVDLEFEKSFKEYKNYFKNHPKRNSSTKIKEIKNGILKNMLSTANENFEKAKSSEDLNKSVILYVKAGEIYTKAAQINKLIGETPKELYKRAAYSYYKAARICQLQEENAFVSIFKAFASNPQSSSIQSLEYNVASAQAPYHYKKSVLYEQSVELFKKAGMKKHADWMIEDGTLKVFKINELENSNSMNDQ